jgi:hypothetical protein
MNTFCLPLAAKEHPYEHISIGIPDNTEPLLPIIHPIAFINISTEILITAMPMLHSLE